MDNLYDFETGEFKAQYRDKAYFDLVIRRHVTQVCGFSGTGKTFLVKLIKDCKRDAENNYSVDDLCNVSVLDEKFTADDLKNSKNRLIVIDNGDFVLNEELLKYVRADRFNNYLIFARGTLNLGISPNYYGEFQCDAFGRITLTYDFSVKGWF